MDECETITDGFSLRPQLAIILSETPGTLYNDYLEENGLVMNESDKGSFEKEYEDYDPYG